MSLYSDYINERGGGRFITETEHGFVAYVITGQECYVEDLYVVPAKRLSGEARLLTDKAADAGRAKGCKYLTCSVSPATNGSTTSLKAALAYGFKLLKSDNTTIYLIKELQ